MENLLVIVVIIYFVANVFGKSTKKQGTHEDDSYAEPFENIEGSSNMDFAKDETEYFSGIEEYFGVKPEMENSEEKIVLPKLLDEKKVENIDNKMSSVQENYTREFIVEKNKSKKKINISKKALQNAIVMSEILGKPVSMK